MDEGKTPTEAAKEVLVTVQKMFEVAIPFETLRSRARHITKKAGEITGNAPTLPILVKFRKIKLGMVE